MSEFQDKLKSLIERNRLNGEKSKFENPRTPVGRTGRLDHAFVEGVIKPTVVFATDANGDYIPNPEGGYVIDYVASNEAREKKYADYDRALSAPSASDTWARERQARLAGKSTSV